MKSNRSISGELSYKIIIAIAVLVFGGIFGIVMFSSNTIKEYAMRNAESSIYSLTRDVDGMLESVQNTTENAVWFVKDNIDNQEFVDRITGYLKSSNKFILGSRVSIDKPGKSSADKCGWTGPFFSIAYGEGAVSYSVPLLDENGEHFGRLISDVALSTFTSGLASKHIFEDAYTVLVNRDGVLLSYPDETRLGEKLYDPKRTSDDKLALVVEKMTAGETGFGELRPGRGKRSAAVYGPVSNGWSVAIFCPVDDIFGGLLRYNLILVIIALFDLLLLYVVTRTIIKRTLMPITEFTYTAMNVAKGNFKAEIPSVNLKYEMQHMHDALVNMLKSINDYMVQLKDSTAENERFESELAIASSIQKQMLRTDFVHNDDVDLYASLIPAKEVGGDMYDFLLSDRVLYFTVGDVSGKGVPAALYMAISRSLFHYVSGLALGSNGVISCINDTFCSGNASNMFITLFVGRLNLDTGELVFCNAGHNPIVVISPDGHAEYLHAKSNLAAGVFDKFPYEKESIKVEKGSRLLIYTDGVSEAENAASEQYGEDRLIEFASGQPVDISSEEFVANLLDSVRNFTNGNEQNDDITIMSVKF